MLDNLDLGALLGTSTHSVWEGRKLPFVCVHARVCVRVVLFYELCFISTGLCSKVATA